MEDENSGTQPLFVGKTSHAPEFGQNVPMGSLTDVPMGSPTDVHGEPVTSPITDCAQNKVFLLPLLILGVDYLRLRQLRKIWLIA